MAIAHTSLSDALEAAAGGLRTAERKEEEMRRKHVSFASKALAERERIYQERARAKNRYDETCHEVESQRQKREKAEAGDKHTDRAIKAQAVAEAEMKHAKVSIVKSRDKTPRRLTRGDGDGTEQLHSCDRCGQ